MAYSVFFLDHAGVFVPATLMEDQLNYSHLGESSTRWVGIRMVSWVSSQSERQRGRNNYWSVNVAKRGQQSYTGPERHEKLWSRTSWLHKLTDMHNLNGNQKLAWIWLSLWEKNTALTAETHTHTHLPNPSLTQTRDTHNLQLCADIHILAHSGTFPIQSNTHKHSVSEPDQCAK